MGTILASTLIGNARLVLQDAAAVRWTDAELLGWLNEGQRQTVIVKPDASSTVATMVLAAGTKQAIPSTWLRLLDGVRNMGTTGAAPGKVVTLVPRHVLDAENRDWHTAKENAVIRHLVYDERTPRIFYTHPPAKAGTYIEASYSIAPTDVALVSNAIALDDIYAAPLTDWIIYRAWLKDAEYASDPQRAQWHYRAFFEALGIKVQNDARHGPSRNAPPYPADAAGATR